MDQTKRGRACELELRRFAALLENLPVSKTDYKNEVIIHEEEEDYSLSITSLVSDLNPVTDKCILTFASLAIEVEKLNNEATSHLFPPLLLYGEQVGELSIEEDGGCIARMSGFVPFLHKLTLFLGRVYQVFRNLLQQLRAFFALSSAEYSGADERQLSRSWRYLGELLAILIQVDEIMESRPILKQEWQIYMRAMETAQHNPSQFGVASNDLRSFIAILVRIEAQLMHGNSLRNCYEQSFGELDDDAKFADRMKVAILEMYGKWEKDATADMPDKRRLMLLVGLCVFHHLHFGGKEKKLIKTIWNSHKKIVAFHLVGDIVWFPCCFLLKEIPNMESIADKKSVQFVQQTTNTLYSEQSDGMIQEAHSILPSVEEWCANLRLALKGSHKDASGCLAITDLILKGARLSDTMSRLLKTVLHSQKGDLQMSRMNTRKVFEIVEGIKMVAHIFSTYWSNILEICQMASHQWRCHILSIVERGRMSCREAAQNDKLSAFNTVAEAMNSSYSRTRFLVSWTALEMAVYKKTLRQNDASQVESLMSRLEVLSSPGKLIARVCDCSFLFWDRALIDHYFDTLIERLPSRDRIQNFLFAISDCAHLCTFAKHTERNLLRGLQSEVFNAMEKGFLYTMCGDIENDLRVLIHKHLSVDERDRTPKERLFLYKSLLNDSKLRVYDRAIYVKEFVERYLERTFYNLTVVALHDRHTYSRMASLAAERYALHLVDGHLPHFSLEQGLDVIGVMKHLNHFVASYNYSLNQQLFIEKDSCSRSLHVLTAQHMSNSLRSHGMGVLNTSVNVTYQLLRKKLAVFSQFLAEEHIKAQLQREVRYFEENKESLGRMFPVKRAEKFNRAIGQLGMADDENSYLDKFRELVTQMGNGLGVVRALTTGAAVVASQMKEYDTLEDIEEPSEEYEDSTLNSRNCSHVVKLLLKEVREQSDRNRNYIKLLIDVFRTGFADPQKFSHLSNFFAIIPSLTVNYVEHMLTCRERLRKRTQNGKQLTFTDDGFVMGIAYLTTVLQQWPQLSSLNWFTSILKRCADEREKLENDQKNISREASISRTTALKHTRLTAYEKEFKLLSYTLQSARVFFFSDNDENVTH